MPITRSNAPIHIERAQPECGMGSSPDSPPCSKQCLCGRHLNRVCPVPLDPGYSTVLDLRVVNSKWRLLLKCVRRAFSERWTLLSRVG
ncbi:hypothetical protein CRG98_032321 [Punica granatum]|uniref:Uncharacterized protein n=1 Tax=Punica granatum TaxID=22663 RepID=A0A2I0ITE9_PUNGR|nr:hypothetical protein CRG98_032321 [Punica granatum]